MRSEGTVLERKLIACIQRQGPLTFRSFMRAALYDPEHGYYNTERLKIGPAGDYYTSSNVHSAFGAVLAAVSARLLDELGANSELLSIAEAGGGTGQLALDILQAMREEHRQIFDRLSYVMVETSPAMRARQQKILAGFGDRVRWRGLGELARAPVAGVVFSNELIDSLPVHSVRKKDGRIEESYVTVRSGPEPDRGEESDTPSQINKGGLAFMWGDPSTPRLHEYLARSRVRLDEGQMAEIGLDAIDWLAEISRALEKGFLVTIDYGDEAEHLYGAGRRDGTLRSFSKHALSDSILERAGEQDITASVNFTALIEYGCDFGLERLSYERQAAFLIRNGLIDRIAAIENSDGGTIDDLKDRVAVKNLFVPGGVSDNFRVLIQRKRPM